MLEAFEGFISFYPMPRSFKIEPNKKPIKLIDIKRVIMQVS